MMVLPFWAFNSCCQGSSSAPRLLSRTVVLHTEQKTSGWVEVWTLLCCFPPIMLCVTSLLALFSSTGQYLDSHRPSWTRWPSPSVPGEVQISCQVRADRPPFRLYRATWLTSCADVSLSFRQGYCLCSGQCHLSEGGERRGRVPIRTVDRHCDLQECPGHNCCMQQTRWDDLPAGKQTRYSSVFISIDLTYALQTSPWQNRLNSFNSSWKRNCKSIVMHNYTN